MTRLSISVEDSVAEDITRFSKKMFGRRDPSAFVRFATLELYNKMKAEEDKKEEEKALRVTGT